MQERVLLVEDDPEDVALFCEALEEVNPSLPCQVLVDGAMLMKEIDQLKGIRLVFLDINMPFIDGWDCLKALRERDNFTNIPIVMYSTTSSPLDARKAIVMGATCFYEKPNTFIELKSFIQMVTSTSSESELRKLLKAASAQSTFKMFLDENVTMNSVVEPKISLPK